MLNLLSALGIITTTDVLIITLSFLLVYTYNWLDLKALIFSEIDVAYAGIQSVQGDVQDVDEVYDGEEGPKKDFSFEVSLPYDPTGIIGPIGGAALKSILMAFVLFVLINVILLASSAACTYEYKHIYMDPSLQGKIDPPKPFGGIDVEALGSQMAAGGIPGIPDLADGLGLPGGLPSGLPGGLPDSVPVNAAQTGGDNTNTSSAGPVNAVRPTNNASNKANPPNTNSSEKLVLQPPHGASKRQNGEEPQATVAADEAKKESKGYYFHEDIREIWTGGSRLPEFNITDALLLKVRLYWLFFVVNFYIPIAAVCLCLVVNLVAVKLIIPHIVDIEKDPNQMKCQVQVLLYANYIIFVGAVWYLAFKIIS